MNVASKTTPVRRCAICGGALKDKRWIYSPSTGQRYCPVDRWEACSARSMKRKES